MGRREGRILIFLKNFNESGSSAHKNCDEASLNKGRCYGFCHFVKIAIEILKK